MSTSSGGLGVQQELLWFWLPQRQACPLSSCWAGLAACAVSSQGGPSCAQVRHGRWQEGEWNCPAEVRPNPAKEVPEGTSRRPWVSTPTSQPLEVNPGHAVSLKLPAWMEAFSFPTAEPKSFVALLLPQGGQERGASSPCRRGTSSLVPLHPI